MERLKSPRVYFLIANYGYAYVSKAKLVIVCIHKPTTVRQYITTDIIKNATASLKSINPIKCSEFLILNHVV